jgi:hypothetical protein
MAGNRQGVTTAKAVATSTCSRHMPDLEASYADMDGKQLVGDTVHLLATDNTVAAIGKAPKVTT